MSAQEKVHHFVSLWNPHLVFGSVVCKFSGYNLQCFRWRVVVVARCCVGCHLGRLGKIACFLFCRTVLQRALETWEHFWNLRGTCVLVWESNMTFWSLWMIFTIVQQGVRSRNLWKHAKQLQVWTSMWNILTGGQVIMQKSTAILPRFRRSSTGLLHTQTWKTVWQLPGNGTLCTGMVTMQNLVDKCTLSANPNSNLCCGPSSRSLGGLQIPTKLWELAHVTDSVDECQRS